MHRRRFWFFPGLRRAGAAAGLALAVTLVPVVVPAGSATPLMSQDGSSAATTTAGTSSANPSTVGQPVMLTTTVTADPPGAGTPTGTVVFSDDSSQIGSATLDNTGTAAITTSSLLGATTA
jgi:hypothetical protein